MRITTPYKNLHIHISKKLDGNMSFRFGTKKKVRSNRSRFLLKTKGNDFPIVFINASVPACNIHLVEKSDENAGLMSFDSAIVCDGLITNWNKMVLALLVADCMPIVLYDNENRILALAHCGFSGIRNRVMSKAVSRMVALYQTKVEDVFCYIGPSIKKESYIYDDVSKFETGEWQEHVFVQKDKTYKVDLLGATLNELINNGISRNNVMWSDVDTYKSDKFFSHRRSLKTKEKPGRFLCICYL